MLIEKWEEAKRAMADYGRLTRQSQKLAVSEEEAFERVRQKYARRRGQAEEERAELEQSLRKFAQARKREFQPAPRGQGRTYTANGVSLGFRLMPPAVRIRDEAAALAWLAQARLERFLRVSREARREALKSALSNGDSRLIGKLQAHGIRLRQHDKFFVEVEKS